MVAPLTIARRFRGPRTSANGGYAAGLLGAQARSTTARRRGDAAAAAAARAPARGRRATASACCCSTATRSSPRRGRAIPRVDAPAPPTFEEAAEAARAVGGWGAPEFDECFVCGTRPEGDGLEIHAGPRAGPDDGLVATTWVAQRGAARDRVGRDRLPGRLRAAWRRPRRAAARPDHGAHRPAAATRVSACVVVGWPLDADGRKRHAATALYGADGDALAVSRQLWIEPRGEIRAGDREACSRLRRSRSSAVTVTPARRRPRRQRHEQPAVLVVGGKEVDRDGLADRRPGRELELRARAGARPTPARRRSAPDRTARAPRPTSRPIRSPSWKPVSSKTPRPAASTRASRSQTMKPGRRAPGSSPRAAGR